VLLIVREGALPNSGTAARVNTSSPTNEFAG